MYTLITNYGLCLFAIGGISAVISVMFQPCTRENNKRSLSDITLLLSLISAKIGMILIILGFVL